MKKPHVLNRAMFNRGGTSAYGRGITSNLVSDEQRQRFNYGGRVGYYTDYKGGPVALDYNPNPWGNEPFQGIDPSAELTWGDVGRWIDPTVDEREEKKREAEASATIARQDLMDLENPEDYAGAEEEKITPPPPELKTDPKSDVIDWAEFAEGLYDKKSSRGEAQLGLAGNVLAAAFQPKKEAMAILGKGLGDFGKTATQRKKKMEDIAATGKMYETIYKTRATEKGKQDRLTQLNKIKTGNPWTDYQAALLSLKDKDDAIDFATGETVRTLTIDTKTKEVEMPSDGTPGELFKHPITQKYFLIDKDGKPQPINIQKYLKNFKLD